MISSDWFPEQNKLYMNFFSMLIIALLISGCDQTHFLRAFFFFILR